MTVELNFRAYGFVDLAVGAVIKGKEAQVFQEYFPLVNDVLKELEIVNIASYAVLECNLEGDKPGQGALSFFKEVDRYQAFMQNPQVIKALPLRDEGMIFLNDGNFFESTEKALQVDSEKDYALVLSSKQVLSTSPLYEMNLSVNSPKKRFQGHTLSIHNWDDETEKLLNSDPASTTVFHIRFFPKQG